MMKRPYRNQAVEEDKAKRRTAVQERFSRRRPPVALTCSVCNVGGTLHTVHLSFASIHLCDVHYVAFSEWASFWIKETRDAGIQHADQRELPERAAAELG